MKKKLKALAVVLAATLAIGIATPTKVVRAGDDLNNPTEVDLVNDEPHELGSSGNSSPGVNGTLNNSTLVVRGGTSTATNLKINQASDSRGYISANSGNGASLSTLATTPSAFPNNQISVTTVGEIRAIGMNVIPDSTSSNPYHVAIVPNSNPLSDQDANALSNVFNQQSNKWR